MKRAVIVGALVACGVLSSATASAQAAPSTPVEKNIRVTATVPHVVDFRIANQSRGDTTDHQVALDVDPDGTIKPHEVDVTVHSNHLENGVNIKLVTDPELKHLKEEVKQQKIPLAVKLDGADLKTAGHNLARKDIKNGEEAKRMTLSIEPQVAKDHTPIAGDYNGDVKVSVSPAS